MHITLIEPFFTGSHQQWAEGWQKYSRHEIEILSMKGRHWKWRMFGGAVTMAREFKEKIKKTDLIVVSDMLDLTTFLALTKKETQGIRVAIYFHENQLTYPWSPTDEDVKKGRHNEYAFMNYTSALAADKLFFNSNYHLQSFLSALPDFLKQFPDAQELQNVDILKNKSEVLHLGVDLNKMDDFDVKSRIKKYPIFLWNHRWEYDKNPESFFDIFLSLKKEGYLFQLIILGEKYARSPSIFETIKKELKNKIIHIGYAESFQEYVQWLKMADVLPVTSTQDFFGGSIVEAMYCGVVPLLPNRLAYPEHIFEENKKELIYNSEEELKNKIIQCIEDKEFISKFNTKKMVAHYDWKIIAPIYDEKFLI